MKTLDIRGLDFKKLLKKLKENHGVVVVPRKEKSQGGITESKYSIQCPEGNVVREVSQKRSKACQEMQEVLEELEKKDS